MGAYRETEKNVAELSGRWHFHAVEIPALGIRRLSDERDEYYFEFYPEGKAVVHVHGDIYSTSFAVNGRWVSFGHMKLAAQRLQVVDGLLYLKDYLGATLIFVRQV